MCAKLVILRRATSPCVNTDNIRGTQNSNNINQNEVHYTCSREKLNKALQMKIKLSIQLLGICTWVRDRKIMCWKTGLARLVGL